jgi:peptide/nickel transport system permease protein
MVAYLILVAFLFVTINFIIDLVFALIDPRVRQESAA